MTSVFWVVLLTLFAAGAGGAVLRALRITADSRLERAVIGVAVGLGLFAYCVFALGLAGLLYRPVLLGGVAVAGFVSIMEWRNLRRCGEHRAPWASAVQMGTHSRWLVILIAACILLNLAGALAPVSFADTLAYHFAGPKIWLKLHQIRNVEGEWTTLQPANMQMLYLLGMGIEGDRLAALFHWLMSALIVGALVLFSGRHGSARPFLAPAMFYVCGIVSLEATSGLADLGVALFAVLAVYAFLKWMTGSQDLRDLSLGGIFAGMAAGCKHTGAVFGMLLLLTLLAVLWRRQQLRHALRPLAAFAVPVFLVVLPWYIWAFIETGDPLYPFLSILRAPVQAHPILAQLTGHDYGYGRSPLALILMPFRLIRDRGEFDGMGPFIGPLYLSFVPFSLLLVRRKNYLAPIWIVFGGYVLAWFLTSQQTHLLVPALPLAAVCAASGFEFLDRGATAVRNVGRLVLAAGLAMGFASVVVYNVQFIPVLIGREPASVFLSRKALFYDEVQWMNRNLPPTARVLLLARPGYYLDREYVKRRQAAEFYRQPWKSIERHNVTHVFCIERDCEVVLSAGIPSTVIWQGNARMPGSRTLGESWRPSKYVRAAVVALEQPSVPRMGIEGNGRHETK